MEFKDYLRFLEKLLKELESLTAVQQKKIAAVQAGDLDALDTCMKHEQAAALALRGLEQHRGELLKQLGLEKVPLRELSRHAPSSLRQDTQQLVEHILRAYEVLSSAQNTARTLMESDLRTIEKQLERSEKGGAQKPSGAHPASNTDFRA